MRHQDILLDLFIKQPLCWKPGALFATYLQQTRWKGPGMEEGFCSDGTFFWGYKLLAVQTALSFGDTNCLRVLLRWGFYTCHHTFHAEVKPDDRPFFIYTPLILQLLVEFNPMCLQESWFVNGKITQRSFRIWRWKRYNNRTDGSPEESPTASSFV